MPRNLGVPVRACVLGQRTSPACNSQEMEDADGVRLTRGVAWCVSGLVSGNGRVEVRQGTDNQIRPQDLGG